MKTFFYAYPENVVVCPVDSTIEKKFERDEASFPFVECASYHMLGETSSSVYLADACVFRLVEGGTSR